MKVQAAFTNTIYRQYGNKHISAASHRQKQSMTSSTITGKFPYHSYQVYNSTRVAFFQQANTETALLFYFWRRAIP